MEIKIDCWYKNKETGKETLLHEVLTENDIFDMLKDRFDSGDLSLPMYLDRDELIPEFLIDTITN